MRQIILAGGFGTRVAHILHIPKQFARIFQHEKIMYSTFMFAIERSLAVCDSEIIITVNIKYLNVAIEQLNIVTSELERKFIFLVEEENINTMIAIYLALKFITQKLDIEDEKILIHSSDHIISPIEKFKADIELSQKKNFTIGLFGIKIGNYDESYKYGNIFCDLETKQIMHFIEKPDINTITDLAKNYTHYWNSGIFLIDKNIILQKLNNLMRSENYNRCFFNKNIENINFLLEKIFFLDIIIEDKKSKKPFDLLIEDNLSDTVVFLANFGWVDIGSPDFLKKLVSPSCTGL